MPDGVGIEVWMMLDGARHFPQECLRVGHRLLESVSPRILDKAHPRIIDRAHNTRSPGGRRGCIRELLE
jgi:hypothetical protein